MDAQFTTLGAIIGLVIAIVLIIKKVQPAYSLILGALIGGLIGGGGLTTTVDTMVSGAQSMMSSVLRIMTSGILAGALMGIVAWMANGILSRFLGSSLGCLASIGAAGVVYFILVIAFRVITYDDCMLLPAGEKIARILRIRG